jgi:hypothetical protein
MLVDRTLGLGGGCRPIARGFAHVIDLDGM